MSDRSHELLTLKSSLNSWAMALTRDPDEAHELVRETLAVANDHDQGPAAGVSTRAWVHGLLRRSFHSVERARLHHRSRSAAVTALNDAQIRLRRARLADEASEAG